MKKRLGGLLLLFAFNILNAEEVLKMEDINVVAQTEKTEVRELHKNLTILTSEEISRSGATNVTEALRLVPELTVRDFNGTGKMVTFDLRGQGESAGNNVMLLLDGVPISPIDMSGNNLNIVPVENIERIEVKSGPDSVLYGDRAIAGTVNIITKKENEKNVIGNIKTEIGSFNSKKIGGNIFLNFNKYKFDILFNKSFTDGYRNHSEVNSNYVDLTYGMHLDKNSSIDFKVLNHEDKYQMPGALYKYEMDKNRKQALYTDYATYPSSRKKEETAEAKINEKSYILNYKYENNIGKLENIIFYNKKDMDSKWSGGYISNSESNLLRESIKLTHNIAFNKLTIGVDYQNGKTNVLNKIIEKETIGSYWYNNMRLYNEKININFGGRSEEITMYFDNSEKNKFNKFLKEYGVNYKYSNYGNIFLGYSQGYRVPATDECFNYFTSKVNKDLKIQTNDNIQFGIKGGNGYFIVKTILYKDISKNEIYYNPYTWENKNMNGEGERKGIEVYSEQYLGEKVILNEYVEFKKAKFKSGDYKGKYIPGVEDKKAGVKLTYSFLEDGKIEIRTDYIGNKYPISDFQNKSKREGSFAKVDLSIYQKVAKGDIVLTIQNLLNRKYYEYFVLDSSNEVSYYPAPERAIKLSYSYNF